MEENISSCFIPRGRLFKNNSLLVVKIEGQSITLSRVILLIKTDKKPTICFVYLGNLSLILHERIALYVNPGSLSKHFLRKYIKKLQDNEYIEYWICRIQLEDRIRLLEYAERFHGTVSRGPAERLIAGGT
jgi:hypothetical protein